MKVSLSTSKYLMNEFTDASKKVKNTVKELVSRELPNCIGAVGEDYGAKWIVSQEQKDKIRKFWEQVPQALKDAIKQSH